MNNRRTILFLFLAAVAILSAHVFLGSCGSASQAHGRNVLVEAVDDATEILVERKGESPTRLVRTTHWRLAEPYLGVVDETMVMKFLDALSQTPVLSVISEHELLGLGRTRQDFSLDDPTLKVTIRSAGRADGDCEILSFGVPTPSGDGVYVAVEGVDAVYAVAFDLLSVIDVPADTFRRRSLFMVPPESVISFDIRNGSENVLSFARDGDGWVLSKEKAAGPKVKKFLSEVLMSEAVSFVWPTGASNEVERASVSLLAGYGLDPESAVTVTFKCADGVDRQISFGKEFDEQHVFALIHDAGAIVTVSADLKRMASQSSVLFTETRLFPVERLAVKSWTIAEGDLSCAFACDEGGGWRMESPIAAPADRGFAEKVLARILSLSFADTDDGGVQVMVSTNARPISVSRRRVMGDARFEDFRSRNVISVAPESVKRIVSTSAARSNASVAIVRGHERRGWVVENPESDKAVDEKKTAALLAALNPLKAVRVEKLKVAASDLDDYGLDRPFLTLAIDLDREDAIRRNILIGNETRGGRFATVGSFDAVFVLPDSVVRILAAPLAVNAQAK